ncbi:unnamed protein product [Adineta ricciae]|uniref:Uncharacterized protein n=1 Tax=Adineta ricciae TaxID=249248 RepID=A0A813S2R1_ADIRI|nr:unnamed protein product [Adineta ricciae]CAF0791381.1 unnamed protein product [Adineta ricciae]
MLVTVTETVGYGSHPVARKRPTDPSSGIESDGRIRSQIPIAGNHWKIIDPAGSCRTALMWDDSTITSIIRVFE